MCCILPAQKLPDLSYDAKAPLAIEEKPVKDYEASRLMDLSFASPRGGRVTAYALIPTRGKRPAGIVWQHWGQGDRSSFLPEALALAERGAASILINAPFRRAGAHPARAPGAELKEWLHAAVDIRRAADVLTTRYGVPATRLAYVGHSYGATLGGVIAAGEPRFRSLVLMGGLAGMPGPLAAIDAERFIGQAAPGTVLLQFARFDRFVSEEQAQRTINAAGKAATVRWYECGHEFNDTQSIKERGEWLARRLDLAGANYVAGR